jgi:putative transposase
MDVFNDDEDRRAYLRLVQAQTEYHGVEVLSWCLMTNHVHFVAVPPTESALADAFGESHRLYTRMKNFREGVRGYLFQGRFFSCVLDEPHLIAAVRYVEQNPVRAKLVADPWEYEWSSAKFHVGLKESDVLVKDRTLMAMQVDWRAFLLQGEAEANSRIRAGVSLGRPMGDAAFLERIERLTGRILRKRKPGRSGNQSNE